MHTAHHANFAPRLLSLSPNQAPRSPANFFCFCCADRDNCEQLHVASVWHYALSEGKEHGSAATFDGFEDNKFHMNAPAPTGPLLRSKFAVLTSTVVETQRSEDGTVKLLVRYLLWLLWLLLSTPVVVLCFVPTRRWPPLFVYSCPPRDVAGRHPKGKERLVPRHNQPPWLWLTDLPTDPVRVQIDSLRWPPASISGSFARRTDGGDGHNPA